MGGQTTNAGMIDILLALSGYCDGEHDLIDIADRHGHSVGDYYAYVDRLAAGGVLVEADGAAEEAGA